MLKPCYNLQTCTGYSTIEEDLEQCRKTGFSAIEVSYSKINVYLEKHSFSDLRNLIKNSCLTCTTINAVFDTSYCEGENWDRIRKELDFGCRICEATGADKIIVLSDHITSENQKLCRNEITDISVTSLSKMADWVKNCGYGIAFEPVGNMLVGDILHAQEIVNKTNRVNVGLVIDDFNLFLWDLLSDVENISRLDSDSIFMVHLNDAENIPFAKIDQMHRCMPGDGRIDVMKYLDCVRATGYDGYVSVEVLNPGIWKQGADIVIPEAYQKLIALL